MPPQVNNQTILTACEYCGHHAQWHTQVSLVDNVRVSKLVPCMHTGNRIGGACKCTMFCPKFESDETSDGQICAYCGRNAFDHKSVKEDIEWPLTSSQGHKIQEVRGNGVIYQVKPQGLRLCCLWTLRHFMRTHPDPTEGNLPVGLQIKCIRCKDEGVMEIAADGFQLGPTWKWVVKPRVITSTIVDLPYD